MQFFFHFTTLILAQGTKIATDQTLIIKTTSGELVVEIHPGKARYPS